MTQVHGTDTAEARAHIIAQLLESKLCDLVSAVGVADKIVVRLDIGRADLSLPEVDAAAQERILETARRFADRRNINLATLGIYALNNARFFKRLERSGDCSLKAYQRMMAYIAAENTRLDAEKEAKRNG